MIDTFFNFIRSVFDPGFVRELLSFFEVFFVIYLIGYSSFLFISVIVGGNEIFEENKRRRLRNEIRNDYYVPISVVVPAYNEEVTIVETIRSLLNLDYRIYEIVVVNDGSKDDTATLVQETFHLRQVSRPIRRQIPCQEIVSVWESEGGGRVPITLINKENGGKADSINAGINASRYPYFVCMDADSILQRDSLSMIAVPVLEDRDVVAVGSMIRISNNCTFKDGKIVELRLPKRLTPAFQVLEYERSFLASRILLDKFNANLIISGAFGLFKKDAVINVGGYHAGCVGEDMELVMKLHAYHRSNRLPYKIKYAYNAVCWTQAPNRFRDLLKQRKRWHIGLMQSMFGHVSMLTKGSYWYYLFYELLSPVIELLGMAVTLLAYIFGLLNLKYMILLFGIYALFGAILTVISFITRNYLSDIRVRPIDILKAFLLCIPEIVFIRFILAWTRILAIFFWRGKKTSWGKIKRSKIDYDQAA